MTEPTVVQSRFPWIATVVAVLFGLLFAWDLFEAIGNLVGIPPYYAAAGLDVPWAFLIVNALVPIAAFGAALLLGRRKRVFVKVVLFAVALCAVAVLSLDAVALLPYA
jgi:hypothetical protein